MSIQDLQQNLSLGTDPIDNAEPCFPHDNTVDSHLCDECTKSNELSFGRKLLCIWRLIEQVCLQTKECLVYECVPSTSILRQFESILLTILQPFPVLPS